MGHLVVGLIITTSLGVLVGAIYLIIEKGKIIGYVVLIGWVVLFFSLVSWTVNREKGPCFEYQTGVHYNPATKTMMPYKKCIDRGEWVVEGKEDRVE
jgi:hypothetical protein